MASLQSSRSTVRASLFVPIGDQRGRQAPPGLQRVSRPDRGTRVVRRPPQLDGRLPEQVGVVCPGQQQVGARPGVQGLGPTWPPVARASISSAWFSRYVVERSSRALGGRQPDVAEQGDAGRGEDHRRFLGRRFMYSHGDADGLVRGSRWRPARRTWWSRLPSWGGGYRPPHLRGLALERQGSRCRLHGEWSSDDRAAAMHAGGAIPSSTSSDSRRSALLEPPLLDVARRRGRAPHSCDTSGKPWARLRARSSRASARPRAQDPAARRAL